MVLFRLFSLFHFQLPAIHPRQTAIAHCFVLAETSFARVRKHGGLASGAGVGEPPRPFRSGFRIRTGTSVFFSRDNGRKRSPDTIPHAKTTRVPVRIWNPDRNGRGRAPTSAPLARPPPNRTTLFHSNPDRLRTRQRFSQNGTPVSETKVPVRIRNPDRGFPTPDFRFSRFSIFARS